MDPKRTDALRLAEEAAGWLVRLEEDCSRASRAEFVTWAKTSPRNVEELLFAHAIWSELGRIDPARSVDLMQLASADEEPVVELRVKGDTTTGSMAARDEGPKVAAAGLAIMVGFLVVAAIAWGWLTFDETRPQVYSTKRGEQNALELSDGSLMHLNTDSRVRVQFSDGVRQVRLLTGEAMFVVEKDRARPFRVTTDDATIQAIGTQFNVDRHASATRVSVVEGVVEVEAGQRPFRLAAGNEAEISHGQVVKASAPDVQRAVAWRSRQLVFRGDALEEVAGEFNRYNETQIRIEGTDVRAREMSGVFDVDDPRPLIDFLADDPELEVTRQGAEVVIRRR